MSLEKLVQLGWYKAEPTSAKEIADLFSIVDRSQADSRVEGISDDLRFQDADLAGGGGDQTGSCWFPRC